MTVTPETCQKDDDCGDVYSVYVSKSIDTVSAIRFCLHNKNLLLKLRWLSAVRIDDHTGEIFGVVCVDSIYVGNQEKRVKLGDWLVLDNNHKILNVMPHEDFLEHYEALNPNKHNVDDNGEYPRYIAGDKVRYNNIEYTVIKQILHYDSGSSFWGDLLLEKASGEVIKVNSWVVTNDKQ